MSEWLEYLEGRWLDMSRVVEVWDEPATGTLQVWLLDGQPDGPTRRYFSGESRSKIMQWLRKRAYA